MMITGKRITAIRLMTPEELEKELWDPSDKAICIELEDGTIIYPSADSEGNAPGKMFIMSENTSFEIKIKTN